VFGIPNLLLNVFKVVFSAANFALLDDSFSDS